MKIVAWCLKRLKKFQCDEDRIICGAGSDEVIQMLCQLFLNPKDEG